MSFALGRRVLDKNNCKELSMVIDAFNDLHDALGNPVNNPGPGVDGTVPDLYTPVYADGDGNLTTGTVLTTVKIIKGDTTASVAGADFTIDGLVSLTEGFTVPAEPLSVNNTIGLSCGNNTPVFAVYNPTSTEWETWTDTTDASSTYYAGLGISLVANEFAIYEGSYTGTGAELYGAIDGTFGMLTLEGWLEELADYASSSGDAQVIGHVEAGDPKYYGMSTIAVGLSDGNCDNINATLTGDGFTVLCGDTPSASETVQNPFNLGVDDNEDIVVVKKWDADTWYLLNAQPEAVALGTAQDVVDDGDLTFTAENFTSLWGKPPSTTETVDNVFSMECALGDPVWAVRYPGSTVWRAVQMQGVTIEAITEITSFEITGGNLQLNFKKATIRVPAITVDEATDSITIAVTECA